MIPSTNTILYPWTIMIHLQNALVELRAVGCSLRLPGAAHVTLYVVKINRIEMLRFL